jgi:hypothetical protein
VNRHERRRQPALADRHQHHQTGYLHRIAGGLSLRPGVHIATVEHDHWCNIYRGGHCDCVPNISVSHPEGDVTVIDERGQGRRVRKQ